MPERPGDWFADQEGNLTAPDEPLKPSTDEFGRDDPAAIERERRRREREQRRSGKRRGASDGAGGGGGLGRLLGRRRAKRTDDLEAEPAPKRRRAVAAEASEAAPRPSAGERAAAGRDALRRRFGGRREGGEDPPSNPRVYRRRRIAALVLALLGVLLLWFLVALFQPFAGEGEGQVVINIPEGSNAGAVAGLLTDNDVVSNGSLFELRLRLAGKSDSILPGRYVLASGMSYGTAIDRLTNTGGKVMLTLPEGLPRDQVAPIVSDAGIEGDYLAATKTASKGFNPAEYGAKGTSLEGFLFPATYELDPGAPVQQLVSQQLDAFKQNIAGVDFTKAQKKNLTIYDVLIIASMVDREVQVPKERPLVAAVIYNRLSKGIPLQIDATTRYLFKNYDQPLTNEQLASTSPYNTRVVAGLPPTPIGNPGLDSIKAAANPAQVDYLFYVVKPGTCGEHNFTADEAEFEQFAAEYQQALEAAGGSPTEC